MDLQTFVTEEADVARLLNYAEANADRNGVPMPQGENEDFFAGWKIEDPHEIDMIKTGKKQLYVYGFVKYLDIFQSKPRETHFCFHYREERNLRGQIVISWAVEPSEANRHT